MFLCQIQKEKKGDSALLQKYYLTFIYQVFFVKRLEVSTVKCCFRTMKGINYGTVNLDDSSYLTLRQIKYLHPILTLDKKKVKNANTVKNELYLQLQYDQESDGDCFCEMRFGFIDEGKNNEMKEDLEKSQGQKFIENIMKHSNLTLSSGQIVASIKQVNFVTPRGRHTLNFCANHLMLHNQTFNHQIKYSEINKGFILPLNNQIQIAIVLSLSRPFTVGQTHHSYLVLQINKEVVEEKIEINKDALKELNKKRNVGELEDSYSGEQFQIIMKLLHLIANISLIQPSQSYKSASGHYAVSANYKANTGWLYMLKGSLIFIPRPVLYINVKDIGRIMFDRAGVSQKNFDMKFFMKGLQKPIEIKSVDKAEMEGLDKYFLQRSIEVDRQRPVRMIEGQGEDEESEQEDEDFNVEQAKESSSSSSGNDVIGSEEESQVTDEKSKKKPSNKKETSKEKNKEK